MKTSRLVTALLTALFVTLVACGDDDDGKEACTAFAAKCPQGAPGGLTCDAQKVNDAANGGDVEDCIEDSVDCAQATSCLQQLK